MITFDQLKRIAPGCKKKNEARLKDIAHWMNEWWPDFEIDTLQEVRHFIAQVAHESDSFNALEEYASGDAYDTRTDLGNTPEKDGDGRRYKGRGLMQTTGLKNYIAAGQRAGDSRKFVRKPELLSHPEWAVFTACAFWADHNLNLFANMPDTNTIPYKRKGVILMLPPIEYISRIVNGGTNGLEDRIKFYERAKTIIL